MLRFTFKSIWIHRPLLALMFILLTACGGLEHGKPSPYHNGALPSQNDTASDDANPQRSEPQQEEEEAAYRWRGALFTGDNSIWAFDNARHAVKDLFLRMDHHITDPDLAELSMMASEINGNVLQMSKANLKKALQDLNFQPEDRCLLHLTSHGTRAHFYLVNQGGMTPTEFDQILTSTCGHRPTVIFISACFSGIFTSSAAMRKPNRIIFTAAREDRTSFGCSAEAEYTYWDGCLIDNLPNATSWENLYQNVSACVTRKEQQGGFTPSLPQLYIGDGVKDLPYLGRG